MTDDQRKQSDTRHIVDASVLGLVAWLTRHAADPKRIGLRVQQVQFALQEAARREKLLSFAARQGVTSARASIAVCEAEAILTELRNVNSGPADEKPR